MSGHVIIVYGSMNDNGGSRGTVSEPIPFQRPRFPACEPSILEMEAVKVTGLSSFARSIRLRRVIAPALSGTERKAVRGSNMGATRDEGKSGCACFSKMLDSPQ